MEMFKESLTGEPILKLSFVKSIVFTTCVYIWTKKMEASSSTTCLGSHI